MELKFVVSCNRSIQAVILNCDNKEDAFQKFLSSRGIVRKDVFNIFSNEYEPYFLGFQFINEDCSVEDYVIDAFYFQIL